MWFYGYVVLRLCGFTVMWFYGYVVVRLCGFTVMWFYGYVVMIRIKKSVAFCHSGLRPGIQ